MTEAKEMVGKNLTSIEGGDTEVTLHFDDGTSVTLVSEGECCSSSWFEHVTDERMDASPATITEVNLDTWGDSTILSTENEYDYLKQYHVFIATTKGRILLEMRKSSNGYYGGYITLRS